eukprot:m.160536 g.160536  ORF g.160536 m.160536 type:complete len:337 (-) comp23794_c0_seq1:96-1106(-)
MLQATTDRGTRRTHATRPARTTMRLKWAMATLCLCLSTSTATNAPTAAPATFSPTAAPTATRQPLPPNSGATLLRLVYTGSLAGLPATDIDAFKLGVVSNMVAAANGVVTAGHVRYVDVTAGIIVTVVLNPMSNVRIGTVISVATELRFAAAPITLSGGRSFAFVAVVGGLVDSENPTPAPTPLVSPAPPTPPPERNAAATRNPALNENVSAGTKNMVYFVCFAVVFITITAFVSWSTGVGCGKDPILEKAIKRAAKRAADEEGKATAVQHASPLPPHPEEVWVEEDEGESSPELEDTFFDYDAWLREEGVEVDEAGAPPHGMELVEGFAEESWME